MTAHRTALGRRALPFLLSGMAVLLTVALVVPAARPPTLRTGEVRALLGTNDPPLVVGITADRLGGGAPLTVSFVAIATGGTGVFQSYLWSFGDGDQGLGAAVNYTFDRPGNFLVTLRVVDSAGHAATGDLLIAVGGPGPVGVSVSLPVLIAAVAGAAGLGAGAAMGVRRWRHRGIGRPAPSDDTDRVDPRATAEAGSGSPVPPVLPGSAAAAVPVRIVPARTLRLSQRVIVHLSQLPALGPYDVGSVDRTQAGMARQFGVRQSAISNVAARLAAAGVLTVASRHVDGLPRRVKVYVLTPYGEQLARRLRSTRGVSVGRAEASDRFAALPVTNPPPRD